MAVSVVAKIVGPAFDTYGIGTAASLGVPNTGQTTEYTPAGYTAQDDGGLQKGYVDDFSEKTTGQYSGTTNITVNAKTEVKSNNVIVDNSTGLMWSKSRTASIGPSSNGQLYWDDTLGSNEDIFEYCDQANAASYAGHTDWRLPNINEMYSIIAREAAATAFKDGFSGSGAAFWSTTTTPSVTANAQRVYAQSHGNTDSASKTAVVNFVMLVRDA